MCQSCSYVCCQICVSVMQLCLLSNLCVSHAVMSVVKFVCQSCSYVYCQICVSVKQLCYYLICESCMKWCWLLICVSVMQLCLLSNMWDSHAVTLLSNMWVTHEVILIANMCVSHAVMLLSNMWVTHEVMLIANMWVADGVVSLENILMCVNPWQINYYIFNSLITKLCVKYYLKCALNFLCFYFIYMKRRKCEMVNMQAGITTIKTMYFNVIKEKRYKILM